MIKKLIKFSIALNMFSTILIPSINIVDSINEIYYSDAVKKVNDVRVKIDTALEKLTEISNGIDKYRDALNDYDDSTNYEYFESKKNYVISRNIARGRQHENYTPSSYAKSCIYKLFDEEIFLIPYYITDVTAECYYVVTSWAGTSWDTMRGWFEDISERKYHLFKRFDDTFYMTDRSKDKQDVKLSGYIDIDKPNASIYMIVNLKSSEKKEPLINFREYMEGCTGWAVFDWYLFKGRITYAITDESKQKLQSLKQRIADFKSIIKVEMNKLNTYNPESDRGNNDYENSNLKQILDNCEQVYHIISNFINLKNNNGWIQKF